MSGGIIILAGNRFSELEAVLRREFLTPLPSRHTLFLARSSERVRLLKERYSLLSEARTVPDVPFLTRDKFLNLLSERLLIPGPPASPQYRLLTLRQLVFRHQPDLRYFRFPEGNFPGAILQGLLQFLDNLWLEGEGENGSLLQQISLEALRHDLQRLMNAYGEALHSDPLHPAQWLARIRQELTSEAWRNIFPETERVIWEDVRDFAGEHIRFVQHLKSLGLEVVLTFPRGENPEVYGHHQRLWQHLQRIASQVRQIPGSDMLDRVFFRLSEHRISFAGRVQVRAATDILQEVETLAGEIQRVVREDSLRYGEVLVTSPILNRYRPVLETVFRRYGIPYTCLSSRPLSQMLVVQHLLLGFQMVREGYPLTTLIKLLHSPFFDYRNQLRGSTWEAVLGGLRVRYGRQAIPEALRRQLRFRLQRAEDFSETEAHTYQQLLDTLEQLFTDWEPFTRRASVPEFYQHFRDLIERHILTQIHRAPEFRNFPLQEETLVALQQLMAALLEWQQVHARHTESMEGETFFQEFWLMVQTVRISPRRPRRMGVQILPPEQAVIAEGKVLFVPGMQEDAFPRGESVTFAEAAFFPESIRPMLPHHPVSRDRELFLSFLRHPARKIYFSYPRFRDDKPVLPSIFLRELKRVTEEELTSTEPVRLFSPSEMLVRLQQRFGVKRVQEALQNRNVSLPSILRQLDVPFLTLRFRMIEQRESEQPSGEWEGVLNHPVLRQYLHRRFTRHRYSVTQLEEYARCPMLYFLKRVLGLPEPEAPEELLTPLDVGIFIHQTLFRFYREQKETQRTWKALQRIGVEEFHRIPVPRNILFRVQQERFLGEGGILQAFWKYEQEQLKRFSYLPRHFELSFGNMRERPGETDPASTPDPFVWKAGEEHFYFKGKIDRVEISPEGNLLVVDYKTGSSGNLKDILEGTSLQLPIYLKVAEVLLKSRYPNLSPAGGGYYLLKSAQDIQKRIIFLQDGAEPGGDPVRNAELPNDKVTFQGEPITLDGLVALAFQHATGFIRRISEGVFPFTEDSRRCQVGGETECPFRPLCRKFQ